jgi:hypothetical protein
MNCRMDPQVPGLYSITGWAQNSELNTMLMALQVTRGRREAEIPAPVAKDNEARCSALIQRVERFGVKSPNS